VMALIGMLGQGIRAAKRLFRSERHEMPTPVIAPEPPKAHSFKMLYRTDGRPQFGPWPSEDGAYQYVTRQACRAWLRALWFRKTSAERPSLSRRDRRHIARVMSKHEYKGLDQSALGMPK